MIRLIITQEANFEIVKVFELGKTSRKMSSMLHLEYLNFEKDRKQKGMSRSTFIFFIY